MDPEEMEEIVQRMQPETIKEQLQAWLQLALTWVRGLPNFVQGAADLLPVMHYPGLAQVALQTIWVLAVVAAVLISVHKIDQLWGVLPLARKLLESIVAFGV